MKKYLYTICLIVLLTGCGNKQINTNQAPSQETKQPQKETSKEVDKTTTAEKPQNKNTTVGEQKNCDTSKVIDKSRELIDGQNIYCVENNLVYHLNKIVENADVNSFEVLYVERGGGGIAKDKNHVYRSEEIMMDIDAKTFTRLERNYFKDKNNVYYYNFGFGKLDFLDVNTFEVLGGIHDTYVKDKNYVYHDPESLVKVESADPDTFTIVNQFYGKDKNNVYAGENILEGANPETFKADETKIINN